MFKMKKVNLCTMYSPQICRCKESTPCVGRPDCSPFMRRHLLTCLGQSGRVEKLYFGTCKHPSQPHPTQTPAL